MGFVRAIVLVAFLGVSATGGEPSLETRLMPLIEAHKGKVALAVKHLDTGETFVYHQDDPMPTASLIKFPVMIEAYRQADEKKTDLEKTITLKKSDKVPGSGILTYHFSDGATFPLRDAIHLMIAFSDNTATNLVLEEIGIGSTAATMERMGYPNTKIHSKVFRRDTSVFPDRSPRFGLGSTTAAEMLRLCEALHKRELVSKEASEAMLAHLRACDDKDKFPRFLPPGTKLAFKTGSTEQVRTATGIIETPGGPVALCVLTEENEDKRYHPDNAGNRLCADVARAVYDHFPKKAKAEGQETAQRIEMREETMGFFETLRHVLGGDRPAPVEPTVDPSIDAGPGLDEPASGEAPAPTPTGAGGSSAYDRAQWQKKLKRVLDELPGSRPEWDVLIAEARALGFDPEWVARCQVEEFFLLIRRAVSDRVFTEGEHRKLDLARDLIGMTEGEAEEALHAIMAEAESFFGKPVEEV